MARTRITKAQKEMEDRKASMLGWLEVVASKISSVPFLFPHAKDSANDAQISLVQLAETIREGGPTPASGPTSLTATEVSGE